MARLDVRNTGVSLGTRPIKNLKRVDYIEVWRFFAGAFARPHIEAYSYELDASLELSADYLLYLTILINLWQSCPGAGSAIATI